MARQQPAGTRVVAMKMGGDGDLGMGARLASLIRAEKPDLVHLTAAAAPTPGAASPPGWRACPACCRGGWTTRVAPRGRHQVPAVRPRDHHLEGIRQVLLSEGLAADRVSCVRSAVDATPYLAPVDRAAFCAEFGLPADALVAGVVAQLIPRRGTATCSPRCRRCSPPPGGCRC